jgi:hypothetical protein
MEAYMPATEITTKPTAQAPANDQRFNSRLRSFSISYRLVGGSKGQLTAIARNGQTAVHNVAQAFPGFSGATVKTL